MRELLTKVFRRAGCGKSARPVRRGGGGPQIYSVTLRPTLPFICGPLFLPNFHEERMPW